MVLHALCFSRLRGLREVRGGSLAVFTAWTVATAVPTCAVALCCAAMLGDGWAVSLMRSGTSTWYPENYLGRLDGRNGTDPSGVCGGQTGRKQWKKKTKQGVNSDQSQEEWCHRTFPTSKKRSRLHNGRFVIFWLRWEGCFSIMLMFWLKIEVSKQPCRVVYSNIPLWMGIRGWKDLSDRSVRTSETLRSPSCATRLRVKTQLRVSADPAPPFLPLGEQPNPPKGLWL